MKTKNSHKKKERSSWFLSPTSRKGRKRQIRICVVMYNSRIHTSTHTHLDVDGKGHGDALAWGRDAVELNGVVARTVPAPSHVQRPSIYPIHIYVLHRIKREEDIEQYNL